MQLYSQKKKKKLKFKIDKRLENEEDTQMAYSTLKK